MDLSDINFGDLSSKANDMVTADNATVTPAEPVTPPAAPVDPQSTPVVPTSTQPPASTTPATPGQVSPAEAKISVDFGNGKVEQLSAAEIAAKLQEAERAGLRQADYTRKTTEAAKAMQAAEQARQEALAVYQRLQQREQVYNDPNVMLAEAQRRIAANQPIDPTQPMTVAQGIEMARAIKAEFENIAAARGEAVKQAETQAQEIVSDALARSEYAKTFNGKLDEVYKENPVLKAFPEMEQVIRYRVALTQPETMEDAEKALKQVAKDLATPLNAHVKQQQQVAEATRAQLVTQGIEPPGGVAPQAQRPDFKAKEGRDLDWKALKDAALGITQ